MNLDFSHKVAVTVVGDEEILPTRLQIAKCWPPIVNWSSFRVVARSLGKSNLASGRTCNAHLASVTEPIRGVFFDSYPHQLASSSNTCLVKQLLYDCFD
jgi:hypothetical protein